MPLLNAPGFVDAVAAAGRAVRKTNPEAIDCPVLLLWGNTMRWHRCMAPGTCALDWPTPLVLVVLRDCGHTPQIEEPNQFNNAVLAFTTSR